MRRLLVRALVLTVVAALAGVQLAAMSAVGAGATARPSPYSEPNDHLLDGVEGLGGPHKDNGPDAYAPAH